MEKILGRRLRGREEKKISSEKKWVFTKDAEKMDRVILQL